MSDVVIVTRAGVGDGSWAERLVCHPRLPLVAALDAVRPAVHVWDCSAGRLDRLATIGAHSDPYGEVGAWDRDTPSVAWHPTEAALAVTHEGRVRQWVHRLADDAPHAGDGTEVRAMHHVPDFDYQHLAFSPDGDALWAWPAHNTTNAWDRSDTIDLRSGTVRSGRAWDTGIVEHPGGGLVATYNSDQGATLVLFARTDLASGPLRFLRRALIIDVDGYEAPVFSSDGRRFAIRGNAYEETLSVYEFPTLRLMLFTTLGDDEPDRLSSATGEGADVADWSRHNIAFDARPGVLWIGRPDGTLLELNLDEETVTPHPLLGGAPVTALGRLVTGDLVAATATGEVVLVAVAGGPHIPDREAMVEVVRTFVDSTSEVPDDDQDLERHLVLADGERSWDQDDLDSVTEASSADPTWLQVQAAVNKMRADGR